MPSRPSLYSLPNAIATRGPDAFRAPALAVFLAAFCVAAIGGAAPTAFAQPVIAPGEQISFATPDGGSVDCRRGLVGGPDFLDCLGARFLGTNVDAAAGLVRARVSLVPPVLLGSPHYATARVFKDFTIEGPPGTFVPVQISARFDFRNTFVMGASYVVESGVSLLVIDLASGDIVASQLLFETGRDGEQGIELGISAASDRRVVQDASGQLTALLRRGRDYRIVFELESLGQALLLGVIESDARADWQEVTVRIDEDEVEQLAEHDTAVQGAIASHDAAVRTAIATHDTAVRSELAQHDTDIKALLEDIGRRQEEIIRLLLTPPGRRESELGSFPLLPDQANGSPGGPSAADDDDASNGKRSKKKSKKNG